MHPRKDTSEAYNVITKTLWKLSSTNCKTVKNYYNSTVYCHLCDTYISIHLHP